jgi:hypothetical protein
MENMQMNSQSAASHFYPALGKFFLNIYNLETFYHSARRAIPGSCDVVTKDWMKGFETAKSDPTFATMLQKASWLSKPGSEEAFSRAMAERAARLGTQSIDSAAIIFAHTILDETLSEACHISFLADSKAWWRFVDEREVKIKDLQSKGVDHFCDDYAATFVSRLARSSMTDRLKHLHWVVAPRLKQIEAPLPTAWIDKRVFLTFDRLRHRLIHKNPFQRIRDVDEKILFAKRAGFSVLTLVGMAYGLDKTAPDLSSRSQLRFCAILRREFGELHTIIATLAKTPNLV